MSNDHDIRNPVTFKRPFCLGQSLILKVLTLRYRCRDDVAVCEMLGHVAIDIVTITEYMHGVRKARLSWEPAVSYRLLDVFISIDLCGWSNFYGLVEDRDARQRARISGMPPIGEDGDVVWLYPVEHEPSSGLGMIWEEVAQDKAQSIYERWEEYADKVNSPEE